MKKLFCFLMINLCVFAFAGNEDEFLAVLHDISSEKIQADVIRLSSSEFGGRLGGTQENRLSAEFVLQNLQSFALEPILPDGSFFQEFANPYTEILPPLDCQLLIPVGRYLIRKKYVPGIDFHPGANSDSGEISAEVVYVGYGISAPELGYDDYQGLSVKGKFVLVEPEVPVSADRESVFRQWRAYSFHNYKIENAIDHGAAGIIFNYNIFNPNTIWKKGFFQLNVGAEVMADLFAATGRNPEKVRQLIREKLRPQSFSTGKTIYLRINSRHYPDGKSFNLLARYGQPEKPMIILSAHLDGQGKDIDLYPSANDNASGVAVLIAVAEALARLKPELPFSVLFAFFGAEEQGVRGSEFFLNNLPIEKTKILFCLNLDGVGRGEKINALAAKNFEKLWIPFQKTNRLYIHRLLNELYFANLTRPRLDAAHFLSAGIPAISLSADGQPELPFPTYHKYTDCAKNLTPEIMEDIARLIFATLVKEAEQFLNWR